MKKLPPALCALCFLFQGGLPASSLYNPPHKSVSTSGQFVVYCDNLAMRLAVSTFCEETKSGILELLYPNLEPARRDNWKIPIVVNLMLPNAALPGLPLSEIRLSNVEGGSKKIELDVTLRGNLADIRFQQQAVRAILLEMEYRDKPPWKESAPIIDPPEWLVEGFSISLRSHNTEMDVDVYKTLLANSDMPALRDFLSQTTAGMNTASLKLYQAYAFSFLQLLAGLPEGQKALGIYIEDLPLGQDAPAQDLLKHFPSLGGSAESLEKWWTLSMARLAASDRYKGLSLEETEQHLIALLKFEIPVDKDGKTKEFPIEDFKEFEKNPQARTVLAGAERNMERFASRANPLYRPIIADYLAIIDELARGKPKNTAQRLKDVAKYRVVVLKRMDEIADYLNWFEATQIGSRSDSFDDYLRTAQQFSTGTPPRNDPITHYLDSLEIQMQ